MPKFRQYKNGIYGHRYKGYYIVPNSSEGDFTVLDENGRVYVPNICDYEDSEWCIDLAYCTREILYLLDQYYKLDISELNLNVAIYVAEKIKKGQLDSEQEDEVLHLLLTLKRRKAKGRDLLPRLVPRDDESEEEGEEEEGEVEDE